jgi:superfamily II DNA or RNA helicase
MDYDKLHKRLELMLDYESDEYFINIKLKKEVSDKLFDYQFFHVLNLMTALRNNNTILDGSDTGTGKTYTSIALCKQLNLRPFIICPKTVMHMWRTVCKLFSIDPLDIVNYETIKRGKTYTQNNTRKLSDYVDINNKWTLPRNSLIIFDEVHRCKNTGSKNAKLLMSTKDKQTKVLMLSATVSDKPEFFNIFGYMLNLYTSLSKAHNWIKGMLREDNNYIGSKPTTSAISKAIYPSKGSRMSTKELGDKFPQNQVSAVCYELDDDQKAKIDKSLKLLNQPDLTKILAERMKIELLKIPIFEELINEYLDAGLNVAVFVNFRETIDKLAEKFKTDCIVEGGQDMATRLLNIHKFQENQSNIILCTIQSGGQSISLHDLHGKQRASIISPCWSSQDFIQVIGRICRAGSKSPAIQRVVYCAGTCEELVCQKLTEKLKFMDKMKDELTDSDFCVQY